MERNDFEAILKMSDTMTNFYKAFTCFSRKNSLLSHTKEWFESEKNFFEHDLETLSQIKAPIVHELLPIMKKFYNAFYKNDKLLKETTYNDTPIIDIDTSYLKSDEYRLLLWDISDKLDNVMDRHKLNPTDLKKINLVIEATAANQLFEVSDIIRCLCFTDLEKTELVAYNYKIDNLEHRNIKIHAELCLETFRKLIRNKDGHAFYTVNDNGTSEFLGSNLPDIHEKFKNITGDPGVYGAINLPFAKVPMEYYRQIDKRIDDKKEDKKKEEPKKEELSKRNNKIKEKKKTAKSSSKNFFNKLWHYITLPFISIYNFFKKLFKKTSKINVSIPNIFTLKNLLIILLTLFIIGYYFLSKTDFTDAIVEFFNTPGNWINDYDMEIVGLVSKWVDGTNYNFFTAITLGLIHLLSYIIGFILDMIVYILILAAIVLSFILLFIILVSIKILIPIACVGFLVYELVISFKDDETNSILAILALITSIIFTLMSFNII